MSYLKVFMVCKTYENCVDGNDWKIIYENDTITQFEIAKLAHKRIQKLWKIKTLE